MAQNTSPVPLAAGNIAKVSVVTDVSFYQVRKLQPRSRLRRLDCLDMAANTCMSVQS
jgi:hypothetical protein